MDEGKNRKTEKRNPRAVLDYSRENEATTRERIDAQLRQAGWEVNSKELTFASGARPQRGINRAIAEWPTASGPADYVLFCGLTPLGIAEAKRHIKDVAGRLPQSRCYSRGFAAQGSTRPPDGWTVPHLRRVLGRYSKSFTGTGYGEFHFLKAPFYDLLHKLNSREFLTPLLKSIQ